MRCYAGVCSSRRFKRETSSQLPSVLFPDVPGPAGSASFVVDWIADSDADGYLVFVSTTTQSFPDEALYSYRYNALGQSTNTLTISSLAAGTYYYRVAPVQFGVIGDLGIEYSVTAS